MKLYIFIILTFFFTGCAEGSKTSKNSKPKVFNKVTMDNFIVQGYYPCWAQKKYPPETIAFNYLTHLSHAFVYPDSKGNLIIPKNFKRSVAEIAHKNGCKILVCIGGGGKFSDHFREMVNSPVAVDNFVNKVSNFILKNDYDGLELDWEFPKSESDGRNLTSLLRKLRNSLGKKFTINLVINGTQYLGKWIDVKSISDDLDYFVIMTYDYHGSWSEFSGHNAPFYPYPRSDSSVKEGIAFWRDKGVEPSKLIFGLPFFGCSFDSFSIGRKFSKSKHLHYKKVQTLFEKGFVKMWDEMADVPYLKQKNGPWIISYDDAKSLKKKIGYVKKNKFAGVMIWEITSDIINGTNALLPGVFEECKR